MKHNARNLALNTFVKLVRAAETASSAVHTNLSRHKLTISQFGVLESLYHLGPMCQKEIAEKLLKSTGNITMVIDNLEKRKLVKRVKNIGDRRYFDIHLTEKGKKLISELFPPHKIRIEEVMAVLSADEQEQLSALCRKFKTL